MTSDRRREARRVFMEVADLPAEEQAAALARQSLEAFGETDAAASIPEHCPFTLDEIRG